MDLLTNIGLYHYLIIAILLFCIGLYGLLTTKNIIKTIFALGLMLSAIGLNFVSFASFGDFKSVSGQSFQIFLVIISCVQIILAISFVVAAKTLKHKKIKTVFKK